MKTKITMIVLLLIGSCSFAQVGTVFTFGGIGFKIITNNTVEVGINRSFSGSLSIPSTVTYDSTVYQVTRIGKDAFNNYNFFVTTPSNLTSVSIPSSVISIGDFAFGYCNNLTSINIPTSVTHIGEYAFAACVNLTSIVLPSSVVSIGNQAFYACYGLTSVLIPNSVKTIGSGAFSWCSSLISVNIPNSVTDLGSQVFSNCTALTTVILSNSISIIKYNCFDQCSNLTSVSIPNSVSTIEERAFQNCTGLTSVTVNWANPLPIITNVFANVNLSNVMLNVPGGTFHLYDAAAVWTEFAPINEPFSLYTPIPDNNFEQALFDQGIDTVNSDNRVLTNAIVNLTTLNVSNRAIADLSGIENFRSLIELNCGSNNVRNLNISSLVLLEKLHCNNNLIGTLDLNSLTSLKELNCDNNQLTHLKINSIRNLERVSCTGNRLTNLDIRSHLRLQKLYCAFNQLNSLNLTGLLFLEELGCTNNHLSSLNLSDARLQILFCGNNPLTSLNLTNQGASMRIFLCDNSFLNQMDLRGFTLLTDFNCTANPYLSCISVDDVAYANAHYQKDNTASFNNDCFGPLTVTHCQNTAAVPLVSPYASVVATNWYTSAVGGRPTLTAPTPSTSTIGNRTFYVSQVWAGVESRRIAITVNTLGIPAAVGAITGVASQGALVGTTIPAVYTVAPVANATVYNWIVPVGVNIVSGQGTTTLTVNFSNVPAGAGPIGNLMVVAENAQGCSTRLTRILTLTKALPAAPTAIRMTDVALATSITGIPTAITNISRYIGTNTVLTLTATPVVGVTTYEWELPAGVTVLSGALPVRGGALGGNSITVNFEGVTTAGMFNYTTTAGILTHVLRIGVRSITGVGASTTSNAGLVNPTTSNTARLLTLTATAPRASSAIRMTDAMAVDPTRAITVISTFIGTPKTLTLTATPVATANEYSWELPAGVKQLSGGNSNVITVNFADVAAGTTSLYLGVKAMNGAGESVTSNASLLPATNSTARLLRLSATVPGTVPAVIGQVIALCGKNAYTYTISPSVLATSYEITGPVGSKVTSKDKATNGSNVIKTSDLEFTVVYPEKFAATKETPASISVIAINGVGKSPFARAIVVTTTVPTPTPEDIIIETQKARFRGPKAKIARRYSEPIIGNPNYSKWWKLRVVVNDGAEIVAEDIKTDEIEVDFSKVPPTVKSTKVFIYNSNSCGVLSLPLIQTIVFEPIAAKTAETLKIEATEVYPNPVVNNFTIDVTASKSGNLDIAIYSLEGIQVVNSKTFELKEGANTITENVSNLAKGIYIVQLLNSSNKEVITKKLIKN